MGRDMAKVVLEIDGHRYFMSGDRVRVEAFEHDGVVSDRVPVEFPDGTTIMIPREDVTHLDE